MERNPLGLEVLPPLEQPLVVVGEQGLGIFSEPELLAAVCLTTASTNAWQ